MIPPLLGDSNRLSMLNRISMAWNAKVYLYVPTYVNVIDYDDFTSYGPDITSPPQSVTWSISVIDCRLTHVRPATDIGGVYKGLSFVPRPGDVLVVTGPDKLSLLENAFVTRNSYILIESAKHEIIDVFINRVNSETSSVAACRKA